jgi:hypothetical protein
MIFKLAKVEFHSRDVTLYQLLFHTIKKQNNIKLGYGLQQEYFAQMIKILLYHLLYLVVPEFTKELMVL